MNHMAFSTIYHNGSKFVVFKEIAISFNLKDGDTVTDAETMRRLLRKQLEALAGDLTEIGQRIKYVRIDDLTDDQKP